jgi:hypothetical protein
MWDAIHKITGESFHSWDVKTKYENPYDEEWICCPIDKIPVKYRKKHTRKINGVERPVMAHFYIKNSESGSCTTGESDQHKHSKILLAHLLDDETVKIEVDKLLINFTELKMDKDGIKIPYRWEEKIGDRRSDLSINFKQWHPLLGRGIDFEIQKYHQTDEEKYERENDWVNNGYSLAWISLDDFTEDSLQRDSININVVWIKRLFQIKYNELSELISNTQKETDKKLYELEQKNFKQLEQIMGINEQTSKYFINTMIDTINNRFTELENNLKYPENIRICKNCRSFDKDRLFPNLTVCWFGIKTGEHKRPKPTKPELTCKEWNIKTGPLN